MLDVLRDAFRGFGAERAERRFGEDDARLALAALLVHATAVDGAASVAEKAALRHLLIQHYGISGDELETLLADARRAEADAVDLYGFTSVLKRQMEAEERVQVVEHLWELVYADGAAHEFEENLVWRAAELLGVSREHRLAAKFSAAGKAAAPEDAAERKGE